MSVINQMTCFETQRILISFALPGIRSLSTHFTGTIICLKMESHVRGTGLYDAAVNVLGCGIYDVLEWYLYNSSDFCYTLCLKAW